MYNVEGYEQQYGELFVKQLELESRFRMLAAQQSAKQLEKLKQDGEADITVIGKKFISYRYGVVRDAVKAFIQEKIGKNRGVIPKYIYILKELINVWGLDETADMCALSTFTSMLTSGVRGDAYLSSLASTIQLEINHEYNLTKYLLSHPERDKLVTGGIDKRHQTFYRRAYAQAWYKRDGYEAERWDKEQATALGCWLIEIVCAASGYFVISGATAKITIIEPTQAFLDAWRKHEEVYIHKSYRLCPTIIPPRPWENHNEGGYYGDLQEASTLLRLHRDTDAFQKAYLKRLGQNSLNKVRQAVNAIQATPWCINTQVLEVMEQLVKLGGGKAGLPYLNEPPKPAVLTENPTEEELKEYKAAMIPFYRGETRRKSKALRSLSHIQLARQFAEYERIYFPCNMDFRGRIYPIPTFSPQGDDLNKGLLLFADVPPCTSDDDLRWFYIHGANLAGVDKVRYTDRITWVQEHEQQILSSAADPLGCDWWMQQDEPVQMLSFCFAYADMVKYKTEHGSIKGWQCGIPIAMDGTCSGLQHFSAILRDPIGAKAVNLTPSDQPNDIYAIVADKVNEKLREDAVNGEADGIAEKDGIVKIKYGEKTLAQLWLSRGVNRKVTKRPTMTLAYGAKTFGFKDQVLADTIEADITDGVFNGWTKENKVAAANYMAKLIWEAVGATVVKAVEGMKWLQECARLVVKDGQLVSWTTPIGLPIQQYYTRIDVKDVMLRCSNKRYRLYVATNSGEVNKAKQSSSIAPNFIHSMDASHLQLTVLNAEAEGIHHFAMIHDSYGAPLSQANTMANVVRKSFVQLYTENDVLEAFRHDMQSYASKPLPEPPAKGDFDIHSVLDSNYIFC